MQWQRKLHETKRRPSGGNHRAGLATCEADHAAQGSQKYRQNTEGPANEPNAMVALPLIDVPPTCWFAVMV